MYTLIFHKNLTPAKWKSFGKTKQLLMIANELNRARNNIRQGCVAETKDCYERAFELIDMTVEVNAEKNLRRELLRCREMLGMQYLEEDPNEKTNQVLFNILISLDKNSYSLLHGRK